MMTLKSGLELPEDFLDKEEEIIARPSGICLIDVSSGDDEREGEPAQSGVARFF